ncbi:MAG: MOSC domain-containing protein [Pseudomonadota bacterium]
MVGEGRVVAVARDELHRFSKVTCDEIILITRRGVQGDAHCGAAVKHRSRVAKDPTQPNLRQVHLIGLETLETLKSQGFNFAPGAVGENITTGGIDLLDLPQGAVLAIGGAEIEVTGLRNPCLQLDAFQEGLMHALLDKGPDGRLIRKAGIMGIVRQGGVVRPGMAIDVALPAQPHRPLERV